jgi:hypothetical protein
MRYRKELAAALLFTFIVGFTGVARAEGDKKPFSYKFKFGAQSYMQADFKGDALAGDDDVRFGIQRLSLFAMGKIYDFAALKVHLLSMPSNDMALALADVHMKFNIHPLFNVKLGRFKKPLTRIYTPFWATWRFFDLPYAFKYVKGNLGLGGRGEGAMIFGGVGKGKFKYSLSVFNGLEEHKAKPGKFERSDESVEVIARLDWQPVEMFKIGGGAAYMGNTIRTDLSVDPNTTSKMDFLAYATDLGFFWKGLTVATEFIGHVTMPEAGDSVLGGGLYADALYRTPLSLGAIEPGFRYTRHFADFDATDAYNEAITGAVQWYIGKPNIRVGLEVSWMNAVTAAASTDSILGLVQVQFVH